MKSRWTNKIGQTALIFTFILLCSLSGPVAADILESLPAQAMLVAGTGPMDEFNGKIDTFLLENQFTTAEAPLNLKDKVQAELQALFGSELTLLGSEGFGVAVLDLTRFEQTLVFYIPVANPEQYIQSHAVKTVGEPGIWQLKNPGQQDVIDHPETLPPEGSPFLSASGNYLLMAQNAEVLSQISQLPKGFKPAGSTKHAFDGSDLFAKVHLGTVMPIAQGMIASKAMAAPQISQHPSLLTMITALSDRLGEIESLAFGGRIEKEGLKFKMDLQAKKASTLASYLSDHPTADLSRLDLLPGEEMIAGIIFSLNPKINSEPLDFIIETLLADETLKDKINPEDLTQLKNIVSQIGLPPVASGLYKTTPPMPAQDAAANPSSLAWNFASIMAWDQPENLIAQYKPISELVTRITRQMGFPIVMNYQSKAGKIDDYEYGDWTMDMSELMAAMAADLSEEEKAAMASQPTSIHYQVAALQGNLLALSQGPGNLQQSIDLTKNSKQSAAKAPALQKIATHLPDKANYFAFVDIGKYIQWLMENIQAQMMAQQQAGAQQMDPGMMMFAMMGPMFGQVQGNIGGAITLQNGCVQMDSFVPNELIQSVGQTIQMMQQMGQGAQTPPGQSPTF